LKRISAKQLEALKKSGGNVRNSTMRRKAPIPRSSPPKNFRAKPVYDIEAKEYHASKAEYRRWQTLKLLEKAGEISDLKRQPTITLVDRNGKAPAITWRMDSSYTEAGRTVYEDVKPRPFTPRENLLIKLWKHFGPGLLRITENKGQHWKVKKEVMPQ